MISTNKECDIISSSYIGKIRSDFMGLVFNAYDTGKNIKESKNTEDIRNILVTIQYVLY